AFHGLVSHQRTRREKPRSNGTGSSSVEGRGRLDAPGGRYFRARAVGAEIAGVNARLEMMSERGIVLADAPERVANRSADAAASSLRVIGGLAVASPEA